MIRLRLLLPVFCAALAGAAAIAHAQSGDGSFADPFRFRQKDGAALYRGICQGCHMPDGRGATGAGSYPALAGNEKLETAGYPVAMVLRGNKAMPGFGRQLSDDQVAAVVNFVRTHFGNRYQDAVTAEDVKSARP